MTYGILMIFCELVLAYLMFVFHSILHGGH
jgi:hypothetical protein